MTILNMASWSCIVVIGIDELNTELNSILESLSVKTRKCSFSVKTLIAISSVNSSSKERLRRIKMLEKACI